MIAHDALSALINLSDTLAAARHMVDHDFMIWLVSYTSVSLRSPKMICFTVDPQYTTSPLSPLTSMLLSNLTSHPSLLPAILSLTIPIIPLPRSKHYPPYFLPSSASLSSTTHPDYRDPAVSRPNAEAGQEPEREIEGIRALVQAFEDGAAEGVKEGSGKRKGECHFLASVFANISMVSGMRQTIITPQIVIEATRDGFEIGQKLTLGSRNPPTPTTTPPAFPSAILSSTFRGRRAASCQGCSIHRPPRYDP